ncbi:flavodoxin family protein [Parvimonas micra]|uniref:flavodoxin family protein n=1 Tax=Parvimonas micra TaxID=33033 RepID=UPI001F166E7E|nr:flavodoxin family protein [Parvimonas micra]
MIGIYLSGTGNTKHCVEKLVYLIDDKSKCLPLENPQIIDLLKEEDVIFLGYPTQFSNAPFMVRDFIKKNSSLWKGEKVFCVNTMGLFSGDGAGCTARILKNMEQKFWEAYR